MVAEIIAEIKMFLDNIHQRLNFIYTACLASIFSRFVKSQNPALNLGILAFFDFIKYQTTGIDIDFTRPEKSKN